MDVWQRQQAEILQNSGGSYNFGTHNFMKVIFADKSFLLICKNCGLKLKKEQDFIQASHLCDEEKARQVIEA
jgi:hypothetical protein